MPSGAQGPGDDVEDDRAAQAADVDGPRRRLAVVDDLRAADRCGELVGPVHRVLAPGSACAGRLRTGRCRPASGCVTIVYVKSPAGTRTTTLSPFLRPSSARPTGDSLEIRPSRGLASVEPTIVNVSLPSSLSTVTVEPIWTCSVECFSSMIVAFLISASRVWIRPSTNACSFLASSYSAFSVRSPCSLASWIRVATSARRTLIISSSSGRSFSRPSRLR